MASKEIIPAVIDYTANLASAVAAVESVGASAKVQKELLGKVTGLLEETSDALEALKEVQQKSVTIECLKERAEYSRDVVTAAMAELRTPADELEKIVDDEMWPFPTYGDLLFEL
jgi:glutamine synthetase